MQTNILSYSMICPCYKLTDVWARRHLLPPCFLPLPGLSSPVLLSSVRLFFSRTELCRPPPPAQARGLAAPAIALRMAPDCRANAAAVAGERGLGGGGSSAPTSSSEGGRVGELQGAWGKFSRGAVGPEGNRRVVLRVEVKLRAAMASTVLEAAIPGRGRREAQEGWVGEGARDMVEPSLQWIGGWWSREGEFGLPT